MNNSDKRYDFRAVRNINYIFWIMLLIMGLFVIRLFYVQVIKYDYYKKSALKGQLQQSRIPATRGLIEAHQGNQIIPFVLNQQLFTLYADPFLVKNSQSASEKLVSILGGTLSNIESKLKTPKTRYVVLAKKISQAQSDKILALKIPGIGTVGQDYRVYPQQELASQILGFVNNDGKGTYGIEQALNDELAGTPGYLKAITDINGVPLAASKNNIEIAPTDGKNIVLTLDIAIQKQVEDIIKNAAIQEKSPLVSAVVMDVNSGAVKAMANYPTYNPANYYDVTTPGVFNNAAISNAIEPGSVMKALTAAAALDQNVIQDNTTYNDPAHWIIDGFKITNIEEDGGAGVRSVEDVLNLSLNTGATWMLMQMGGGQVNQKARQAWYDYETNHFKLGSSTGIEQGYDSPGVVPRPNIPNQSGDQQDLTYANTSFGQGLTVTAVQMASALSSIVNGGKYYRPYLSDGIIDAQGNIKYNKPKIIDTNVVTSKTSKSMVSLLQQVVTKHFQAGFSYLNFPSNYIVGGKTGTAQVANPKGGYMDHEYNGTYLGFVGGDKPQYAIAIFVTTPTVNGYAGSYGAQPIFGSIAHMLINESFVSPKGS
ncbi:MAG: penicillin-binding protein 2 [bacterium]